MLSGVIVRMTVIAALAGAGLGLLCSCSSSAVKTTNAVGSTSGTATRVSASLSTAVSTSPRPGQRCTQQEVHLDGSPAPALAIGEHAILFTLENAGPVSCMLTGYPQVTLYSASGEALPFRYSNGHSSYVTKQPPKPLTLGPGGIAYVLIAKYFCAHGAVADTSSGRLAFPHLGLDLQTTTDTAGDPFAYCRGSSSDAGQFVAVSPAEPDISDAGGT